MLANVWRAEHVLADFWVSEKLDGVRGYWDGARLWTRGGQLVPAPSWFTAGWPTEALDGELWAGRGRFEFAQSTVATDVPSDAAWREMRFMVFDLPADPQPFDRRKDRLVTLMGDASVAWLQPVAQQKVASRAELRSLLNRSTASGAEGLMLHRGASLYRAVRSDDLLKLKLHDDAEARVVAYLPGKGRYVGMMGALVVEMPTGKRFRLGTGFVDADRRSPPAIGSVVTYRYRGTNPSGIPRFASYLRVRLL